MNDVHDIQRLKELQALPLERKIQILQARVIEWYLKFNGKVFISDSGGKDSAVLRDLVHRVYPDVPCVFSNTGLEYPEIQKLAKEHNAQFLYPQIPFPQVVMEYGYPLVSKEIADAIFYARRNKDEGKSTFNKRQELLDSALLQEKGRSGYNKKKWLPLCQYAPFRIGRGCCSIMKKLPIAKYKRESHLVPYLGTTTEESKIRQQAWLKHGCNAFDSKTPSSQPLSFWTEQDILRYIKEYDVKICSVYGDIIEDKNGKLQCTGCQRTGCIFCCFGMHLEKGETRFQRLAKTHPRQYEYALGGGQWIDNPDYDEFLPEYTGEWKNWNPKQIWIPSKEGLGLKKVFDIGNEIYGKQMWRYE